MRILFLHGWGSRPGGIKPAHLKASGLDVTNPALPDDDFEAAVRIAQAAFDGGNYDVVVGSSRGGAVAMNIDSGSVPLVLVCPAWRRWGNAQQVKRNTIVLHSESDEVVPFEDSVELLKASGLQDSALWAVGHDHSLTDPESLRALLDAIDEIVTLEG